MKVDALVAPLRADVVSGAAVIGRTAAEVVRRAASRIDASDPDGFRDALVELSIQILEAQPAMAPLVSLAVRVLDAADGAETVEDARRKVEDAAASFRETVESGGDEVARTAARELSWDRPVLTLSASSTVRKALELAGSGMDIRVVCLESRPVKEGRRLAQQLVEKGIRVTCAVDAAAASLLPDCGMVLMGADSVGDRGLVNKIGSRAVCLLAREAGVPVRVLADRTKLLPPGFPQPTDDDRPGEEAWRKPPPGIRVWNRYFETVPVEWTEGLVTETGIRSPSEVEQERAALPVPDALRRWTRAAQKPIDTTSGA